MAVTTNQPVPAAGGPGVIFASASRTGATNSPEFFNPSAKGVRLYITNVAEAGATATVKIQVKDPVSKVFVDLAGATTAALGAVAPSLFTVYPEGVTAANVYVLNILGVSWRAVITMSAAATASVGGEYLI
jgi:hypothetical protein